MSIKVINKQNYKIILDDGKVSTIYQTITEVRDNSVKVLSKNNKEYFVKLSDKVKFYNEINVKDTAVIKTFDKCWLVVDVIKYEKEEVEDDDEELKRQLEMFKALGGGY